MRHLVHLALAFAIAAPTLVGAAPAAKAEAPTAPAIENAGDRAPADATDSATAADAPRGAGDRAAPDGELQDRARRLRGEWPRNEPAVTLDLDRVRTREALTRLAAQAGWSLEFKEPARGRVDLSYTDARPTDVLLAILDEQELVAERRGNVITISSDERAASEAPKDGGKTALGRSLVVPEGQTFSEAVAVVGGIEVQGAVSGDVVAVGGNIELGPRAVVGGDVVVVGGTLREAPGARIEGDRVVIGRSLLADSSAREAIHAKAEEERSWFANAALDFGSTLLRYVALFVLGLLLLSFAPNRLRSVGEELRRSPLPCAGIGFLGACAVIPIALLLFVTIIGILALPLLGLAVAVALLFGFSALALIIGEQMIGPARRRNQVLVLALGVLVLFVVDLVPYLGFLVLWAASFVVFGAALRTRFGSTPVSNANFAPEQ